MTGMICGLFLGGMIFRLVIIPHERRNWRCSKCAAPSKPVQGQEKL